MGTLNRIHTYSKFSFFEQAHFETPRLKQYCKKLKNFMNLIYSRNTKSWQNLLHRYFLEIWQLWPFLNGSPFEYMHFSHLVKLEILQPKSLKKFNAFFIRCTAQLLLTNELFRIWLNCKIECLGEKKWPDALCANGQCHAHYSDIFDKTPYSKFLNYIRRFKAKSFVTSLVTQL